MYSVILDYVWLWDELELFGRVVGKDIGRCRRYYWVDLAISYTIRLTRHEHDTSFLCLCFINSCFVLKDHQLRINELLRVVEHDHFSI